MRTRIHAMSNYLDTLNGVVVAYAIGLVNALMALLFSFGVNVSTDQRSAIVGFVNAALILVAHLAHRQAQHPSPPPPAPPAPPTPSTPGP